MAQIIMCELELHCKKCRVLIMKVRGRVEQVNEYEVLCADCAKEIKEMKR